jgi:hypothetical protein
LNTSGRNRIEKRLARATTKLIDMALKVVEAERRGDHASAAAWSLEVARRAVRASEAYAKYDSLGPRARAFFRRQHKRPTG